MCWRHPLLIVTSQSPRGSRVLLHSVCVCLNGSPQPMTPQSIEEQLRVRKLSLWSEARMRNSCSLRTSWGRGLLFPPLTLQHTPTPQRTQTRILKELFRDGLFTQREGTCLGGSRACTEVQCDQVMPLFRARPLTLSAVHFNATDDFQHSRIPLQALPPTNGRCFLSK